jgi:RHS repeat-associated protein
VRTALGTADEASEGTTGYTANGEVQWVKDGENNKTTYEYDGHDRLTKTYYPSPTKSAGTSNASDYEQSTYESLAGGTRTSPLAVAFRNRFGFTGQIRLDGHYYYKARFYHPKLGRFFQPDPIGYGDGMNRAQSLDPSRAKLPGGPAEPRLSPCA